MKLRKETFSKKIVTVEDAALSMHARRVRPGPAQVKALNRAHDQQRA